MEEAVEWCQLAGPTVRCTVLVCGGDGTVGWFLNTVERLLPPSAPQPVVAIFPLGTGNDLARTLGYGSGADASEDIAAYLARLDECGTVMALDRWKVDVLPKRHLRIRLPKTSISMNNYLSIGVDALVTHNFHKARESPYYLFSSRFINKLIYFSYGTKDVLERQCQNLNRKLSLFMDGKKIELPNIESVVILNIPFWGAGVQPWTLGTGHKSFACEQSFADKRLEVFCIYSSFHIAQMQVGLSEPHRIGQAREIRIQAGIYIVHSDNFFEFITKKDALSRPFFPFFNVIFLLFSFPFFIFFSFSIFSFFPSWPFPSPPYHSILHNIYPCIP